ncbi:hypothetical protein GOODEAATRI_029602 [Goodea atripinnis]|uniref:Subtilisin/kexin-like protease PC9 n=1 Tax=Goodea atripinnis TaxID=208336 RepID=A0ABV0NP82_9TELE
MSPSTDDGEMAEVYLMDGSVQSSHREVEGRVFITDFNNVPEEDGVRVHRQASQCDGHGTHLAGVVTGSDSGVARRAGVNLVRVLNCQGKGTVSGALAGRMVITVGAVNSADQFMSQGAGGTNFGRCVDLFAPGDDIVSASSECSTCFTSQSGTSQAAAHAAGIAAVILSSSQIASPVQVLQMMLHYSISNTINFLPLSETHRLTTPNLVAAMPPANSPTPRLSSADTAVSRCRIGEEMMGCSSYAPDGARIGETVTESNGRMECVAYNGPAGCTTQSATEISSDSRPHHGARKSCIVKDGVTSHAVCCHAPSLQCHLLETTLSDKDQVFNVELSCPPGWTLTDCSTVSQGSAVVGSVPRRNSCFIHIAGQVKAAGIAVCCRVTPPESPATTPN